MLPTDISIDVSLATTHCGASYRSISLHPVFCLAHIRIWADHVLCLPVPSLLSNLPDSRQKVCQRYVREPAGDVTHSLEIKDQAYQISVQTKYNKI